MIRFLIRFMSLYYFHNYANVMNVATIRMALFLPEKIKGELVTRERGICDFYSGVVTRRHSFGKSVLTTLYSKMVRFFQNARLRVSQETD